MEKVLIGKCKKCNADIYESGNMKIKYCTRCGAKLDADQNQVNSGVQYKEKPATSSQVFNSVPFEVDKQIPGFGINKDTAVYAGPSEVTIERGNKAAWIFGITVAAAVLIASVTISTVLFVKHRNNTLNTDDIVLGNTIEDDKVPTASEPEVTTGKKEVLSAAGFTEQEKEAIQCAQHNLSIINYSKQALIDELTDEYNGFSLSDATTAVQYLEDAGLVDWKQEATEWAQQMLDSSSFSRAEMTRMLTGEASKYTAEEVEYALSYLEDNNLVDWNEEAKGAAEQYMKFGGYTRESMIDQLMVGDNFLESEAEYATDALGL